VESALAREGSVLNCKMKFNIILVKIFSPFINEIVVEAAASDTRINFDKKRNEKIANVTKEP